MALWICSAAILLHVLPAFSSTDIPGESRQAPLTMQEHERAADAEQADGSMARSGAGGDEWPQWRGPLRNGVVTADFVAGNWPEKLTEQWSREVGEGYSGPVVVGNRLWVHARNDREEVVRCLRLDDGREVWSAGYEAEFVPDPTARDHGKGPFSTPAVADDRLFTLGMTSILTAWQVDSGDLLWRREYSGEFTPSFPYFGAAASPLVWSELCFVHFGFNDGQKEGVPGRGAMVALQVADGGERWRWEGDAPAMGASPMIVKLAGTPHLVFKSEEHIVGLDPLQGRELWRIPFEVAMDNTITTPLFVGDRLMTSDYEKGFQAWSILEESGSWSVEHVWRNRDSLFLSSPVIVGDVLVGFTQSRRGHVFGLDPMNGTTLWRGDPNWGEHASLLTWGNEVLVFREDGTLIVGEVSRECFRPLRTYRLGNSGAWSHPAVFDRRIIIRDENRLRSFRIDAE